MKQSRPLTAPGTRGTQGGAIPHPPDLDRHVLRKYPLERVFTFINEKMLYCRHLGLRGEPKRLFSAGDAKALELKKLVEEMKDEAAARKLIESSAVFSFFGANSEGDSIKVFAPSGELLEIFPFPRRHDGKKLCLSDFTAPAPPDRARRRERDGVDARDWGRRPDSVRPPSPELSAGGTQGSPLTAPEARGTQGRDYIAMFAVTCGKKPQEEAAALRKKGELVRSHLINILSIVCAEALAEAVHEDIRRMWGFPDPPGTTLKEKLRSGYRGKRFSFGYPQCPDLSNQSKLFKLLKPDELGITLTDSFMMEPEASVTALVFHHQRAEYF
ncbi:MAG: vitamin B12 dependent-methionine synthase activation domain-containing protein [bacterium]